MLSLLTEISANGRALPLRITAPNERRPHPVILFSHGHRYSHDHYRPLVDFWGANGFVVIQPRHEDAAERDAAYGGMDRPNTLWRWRVEDLQAVLDALEPLQLRHGELAGRIDPARIVAAGHSFGAHTVQALAGAQVRDAEIDLVDSRVRAVVLIAAPGAGAHLSKGWVERTYLNVDWSGMNTPALVIAGDMDQPWPMSPRDWAWRLDSYDQAPCGGRYALVVAGADHFFGGIHKPAVEALLGEALRLALVQEATTAFLRTAVDPADPSWSHACARYSATPPPVSRFVSK